VAWRGGFVIYTALSVVQDLIEHSIMQAICKWFLCGFYHFTQFYLVHTCR